MERPAKSAAHRVAGLMSAFALLPLKPIIRAHSGADIGRGRQRD
jgi:hypothetical protein